MTSTDINSQHGSDKGTEMSDLEKIEARIQSGDPFTFTDIWVPVTGGDHHHPAYRLADRTVQKWRKAGRIRISERKGSTPLWELVPRPHTLTNEDRG